jgi:mutator protein MutT
MAEPFSVTGLLIRDGEVCAVSRLNRPEDLGLPGGKIEPGETPDEAVAREVFEEIGVKVIRMEFCFERVDKVPGRVCWCYRIEEWEGEPRQMEPGHFVSWEKPIRLLDPSCTFCEYNDRLFASLGLI